MILNKKTLTVILLSALLLSGCASQYAQSEPTESSVGTSSVSSVAEYNGDLENHPAKQTAVDFVTAMLNADYDTMLSLLDVPQDVDMTFFTTDNLKYVCEEAVSGRANLCRIDGGKVTSAKVLADTVQSDKCEVEVTVSSDDEAENCGFEVVNINGEWKMSNSYRAESDIWYYTNHSLRVPGGNVKVTIDDVEIPQSFKVSDNAGALGMETEYKIPIIGDSLSFVLKVESENFSGRWQISPGTGFSNNEAESYNVEPQTDSENERTYIEIMRLWNGLYEEYSTSPDMPNAEQYIASDADADTIQTIRQGFEKLSAGKENVRMTDCSSEGKYNWQDENTAWVADNKLYAGKVEYTLEWSEDGSVKTMNKTANVLLAVEDGNYKIAKITDPELFSVADETISDWQDGD